MRFNVSTNIEIVLYAAETTTMNITSSVMSNKSVTKVRKSGASATIVIFH